MTVRYAIYAVPAANSSLWRLACAWLGRDPETEREETPPMPAWLETERWREVTADARLYGFHGTLKPPMALSNDATEAMLDKALAEFARTWPTPRVSLHVASIGGFLALVPQEGDRTMRDLADRVVEDFDPFRAAPSQAELARRRLADLSPAQEKNLVRWGYPYVFDEFRYHMTLTARLPSDERAHAAAHLSAYLAPAIAEPAPMHLGLFTQSAAGAPFRLAARYS